MCVCLCVCAFYSWHMVPSSTCTKGFLRWGCRTLGHSVSAGISILYVRCKWKKLDFMHLCVRECTRVCVSDSLLTLLSISLLSFTVCCSSSCPGQRLLLHALLVQKPFAWPCHTTWRLCYIHTHKHTLHNKCVRVSGGIATLAGNTQTVTGCMLLLRQHGTRDH